MSSIIGVTIPELAKRYSEALKWLNESITVHPASRFQVYEKLLLEVAAAHETGNLEDLFARKNPNPYALILSDIFDLLRIHKGLKKSPQDWIRRKLLEYTSGPLLLEGETTSVANRARNTGLELTTLSLLCSAGFHANIFESIADVHVQINGLDYFMECKRPQSNATISENLKKSLSQLKERLQSDPAQIKRGVFVLGLDKALFEKGTILTVANEASLEFAFGRMALGFIAQFGSQYLSFGDNRLMGGILYYNCLVRLQDENRVIPVEQLSLISIGNIGEEEKAKFLSLANSLYTVIKDHRAA